MERERLLDLALMALEEVTRVRGIGEIGRPVALRFLLAYLYAESGGGDRKPFERYWTLATDPGTFFVSIEAACNDIASCLGRSRPTEDLYRTIGRGYRLYGQTLASSRADTGEPLTVVPSAHVNSEPAPELSAGQVDTSD